ncbi:hypothetical protein SK128_018962 [Halocaridina rubra]|uniref:Uncharacterized protein n=1 Tax=Halocaridina rubra TaxID=373956 RepID=A0AAN8WVG1_HALRR
MRKFSGAVTSTHAAPAYNPEGPKSILPMMFSKASLRQSHIGIKGVGSGFQEVEIPVNMPRTTLKR